MDLLVIQADGRPADGAVVGVAAAPPGAAVTDLGLVADADGRVTIDGTIAGDWTFAVWHQGRGTTVTVPLDATTGVRELRLPP